MVALLASCAGDVEPIQVSLSGPVGSVVGLRAEEPVYDPADIVFEWRLEQSPQGSATQLSRVGVGEADLLVDEVGLFVVDRWVRVGLAETWTHRFTIEAQQAAPVANIAGNSIGAVGEVTVLDGSDSFDAEGAALEYSWALTMRPGGSSAELSSASGEQTSVQPDVAGRYVIELEVFDGQLWSEQPAIFELFAEE